MSDTDLNRQVAEAQGWKLEHRSTLSDADGDYEPTFHGDCWINEYGEIQAYASHEDHHVCLYDPKHDLNQAVAFAEWASVKTGFAVYMIIYTEPAIRKYEAFFKGYPLNSSGQLTLKATSISDTLAEPLCLATLKALGKDQT